MKKILSLLIIAVLLLGIMTGCNVQTKDQVTGGNTSETSNEPVDLNLLAMSSMEKDANILRDQLSKAGFNVKLNIQPDYSSYVGQKDAGNYDMAITSWNTVTGNPDYAVRSLFISNGDYNDYGLVNEEIDRLINEAATQTSDQYVATYKTFEEVLVKENAYIIPLYSNYKSQAVNNTILKVDSVRLSKSRSLPWENVDFIDESKGNSEPLIFSQTMPSLTSLDPIKGNDGSINIINTNMYVRLVNLTDNDEVTSVGSLSHNHAIGEGNTEYYFILRDDINFAKVDNKKAVDSGELVAAEDVVFSMDRARNKDSVPDHRTFTLHSSMEKIEIVTDLKELESKKQSGNASSIKDGLEAGLSTTIKELVADKAQVSNKDGKYQVVKITTNKPFPQVLNYLAHQSAGIVSKKQIEAVNTYNVATFDRNKDVAYGDQMTITEGATYDNTLMTSGPYIAIYKNDYEIAFQKNPGYMISTSHEPKVSNIVVKFIKDADSSLSAFRSGEIHFLYGIPEDKFEIVENDSKLTLQKRPNNAVVYAFFNMKGGSEFSDVNLRKAILYNVSQEEFIAVYNNLKINAYSTVTPLVDTGNIHLKDHSKANEFLNMYWESKE
ncbi:ABC transporter substrate-binding protein [Alkaliphilus peptidifermentans]|uniref:Peptide/nickel transport system substrate-binding protein n=1 Tax=Alkaliphilus peptidifermentans DSM 18978 TaxID=1120976 RepID=A0A1G5CXZ7_9FIRM|nr:ABC transporter substrate-binding protein [Alkaliphilus peptidifermentans]SCY07070.1 peptide/nickel transport system substrate-binding protein [Alkaliphilus peptidifermentans DSM 18978]